MTDLANLIFVAAKHQVSAVDGQTGDVLWTTKVPGSSWFSSSFMTLAVDPTGVYACHTGKVSCLDPISGRILWTLKVPDAGQSLPVVATMLGGSGDANQSAMIAAAQSEQAAAVTITAG